MNGIPLFEQGDAREALKKRCREAKVSIVVLEGLVQAEIDQVGKRRKTGLWDRFDDLLNPAGPPESEQEGN